MVSSAGSGNSATTSAFASLERTLDRTVESLTKGEASPETRALLIEARRLRSVVANWRSIPPPSDVYDEMLDRVLHLSTSAGASLYDPAPDSLRTEFDPLLRTDYDPSPRGDLDPGMRTELDAIPLGAIDMMGRSARGPAADAPRAPRAEAFPPPIASPRPAVSNGKADPREEPVGPTPGRHPSFADDRTEAYGAGFEPRAYSLEEPSRAPRPPMASSPVIQPADQAQTRSGIAPRGHALGTKAGIAPFAAQRASQIFEDAPAYPTSDARGYADMDEPSYPAFDRGEVQRALADAGRYGARPQRAPSYPPGRAQSTPPTGRAPSYPPARASSIPPPPRAGGYGGLTTGDRLRAHAPPELALDREDAVEDAPVAPTTSIVVHGVALGEKIDPNVVLLSDPYSERADAYRALRRKLASSGNPQVIAITSPEAGEGKTTCALNLALAMRESSRGKVLLIEANGRSPAIARILGLEMPECFFDQILQHREDPLKPWVALEPMPKLHIMAVNPAIKRAPQLDPIAFSNGMERLKLAGYEYILLDTPPVLGAFEVNMVADNVAGVLFTAITMKSKRSALRKAIEQIMPAPVLGVMVLDS